MMIPVGSGTVRLVLAVLVLQCALVLPPSVDQASWRVMLVPQAELPLLSALLIVPAGRYSSVIRGMIVAILISLLLLRLADMGTIAAFGRPFDLFLDWHLAPKAMHLMAGSLGSLHFVVVSIGSLLALAAVGLLLYRAAERVSKTGAALGRYRASAAVLLLAGGGLGLLIPPDQTAAQSTAAISTHVAQAFRSAAGMTTFRAATALDPTASIPAEMHLAQLEGKDVVIVFIESYGATALTDPAFKNPVGEALAQLQQALAAKGFAARSAFLTSTTIGGQSWLAHASLLGGLPVDNQRRYEAFVSQPRHSLVGDFASAGWETVAVAPAITQPWPEVLAFSFDRVLTASDLGYQGQPFNWVTMPDQFTLAAFEKLVRAVRNRPPVMAQIALISSHAPWTPLPQLVNWDVLGDGRIFDPIVAGGEAPDTLWRDPQRVRIQYRRSIEYTLATIAAYIRHFGDENLVLILLGDHPPAPWIAGGTAREVPIHILAGDPVLLSNLDLWRWTPGLHPGTEAPVWPMASFRGRFLQAFSKAR